MAELAPAAENRPGMDRRTFLSGIAGLAALGAGRATGDASAPPNVILCMADDLGWGDTGYNGHPHIKTPNLDAMAASGLRFDRFYAAAPVCSPTRGSCLTGRHPYRYGIHGANKGHMLPEETTLAEALRSRGYTTGHFGKWHLGTLTTTIKDSNRGGLLNKKHYALPSEHGFDAYFSTEAKVPTRDPMVQPANDPQSKAPGEAYGTYYWAGPDKRETENLEGDDSRIIMDRAIPFIEGAVARDKPFFAVIWFHAPHLPVVAGPEHREAYASLPEEAQHYFGCITALDQQMGRLRATLRKLGAAEDTMLWFCSDNGPEGAKDTPFNGSSGPYRGRKRDLLEGGVRVPGLLEWPARIDEARTSDMACCTSDYFPTVLEATGAQLETPPKPADGISLMPLIEGRMAQRPQPIAFEHKEQVSLSGNQYKLISLDKGKTYALYDLVADPGETTDLSAAQPERAAAMRRTLDAWRASCAASSKGADYPASP